MVLQELLKDSTIAQARVQEDVELTDEDGFLTQTKAEEMKENLHILREPGDDSDDDEEDQEQEQKSRTVVSFQVRGEDVEKVKRHAIELDYPLMEEYDFKNDQINPNVPQMDLKPHTRIRRYQERSLAKMFGNGRARSVSGSLHWNSNFLRQLSHTISNRESLSCRVEQEKRSLG